MTKLRQILAVLVAMLIALATTESCRAPTQMTIRIETDPGLRCSELKRVIIVTGPTPEEVESRAASKFFAADTRSCADEGTVGSLVITPAEDHGAVLVMTPIDDTAGCEPPDYKGCIVSRRYFSFMQHVREELTITLELDCRDVPCGAFTSCRRTKCVDSSVDCDDDGVCRSAADPTSPDDGGAPTDDARDPDGQLHADAASDAKIADSSMDAPESAPMTGKTNSCPQRTETQCGAGQHCCLNAAGTSLTCVTPPCAPAGDLTCTGARDCTSASGGENCCLFVNGAMRSSSCGTSCMVFLCGTADDCEFSNQGRRCGGANDVVVGTTMVHVCQP